MAKLLVSVRSVEEAQAALAGGADLIDVKDPAAGALGRARPEVLAGVLNAVQAHRPISAAMGEAWEAATPHAEGLAFVKWGLAGMATQEWRLQLKELSRRLSERARCARPVAVGYADCARAGSPPPDEVCRFAYEEGWPALLVDTWCKDGSTLLDWLPVGRLARLRATCRRQGVRLALAGSLGREQIRLLMPLRPDWFAVRGAACRAGLRDGIVSADRVAALGRLLRTPPTKGDPVLMRPGKIMAEIDQSDTEPGGTVGVLS